MVKVLELREKGLLERALKLDIYSDKILYKMCADSPKHLDDDIIKGKIMMIGRVYSASTERTKEPHGLSTDEDFYLDKVAPTIRDSEIDQIIKKACETDGLHFR